MRLDELMLVETLAAVDQRYPAAVAARPIDAGFVLTWRERDGCGAWSTRKGMVLGLAPRPETVWVQPDDQVDGEGLAVVVNDVTAKHGAAGAWREVGGPGDHLSTRRWQQPRRLPRAWLRTDTITFDATCVPPSTVRAYSLHADPGCPVDKEWRCVGGRLVGTEQGRRDDCYVYDRWLHPLSVRPVARGRPVRICGRCLLEGCPA